MSLSEIASANRGPGPDPEHAEDSPADQPLGRNEGVTRELGACAAVSLMTGSDDTVFDDVSIRTTLSLTMFPLSYLSCNPPYGRSGPKKSAKGFLHRVEKPSRAAITRTSKVYSRVLAKNCLIDAEYSTHSAAIPLAHQYGRLDVLKE